MYPGPSPVRVYRCILRRDTIVSDISEFYSMSTPENVLLQGRRQAEEGTGQMWPKMWANMTDR